ncbi:MAG: glycoside hydrolase family 57 protein [Pseudomonadota bacterium]
MMNQPKLLISLYWHMHQPDYRDSISGEYVLPWTYLHAIKDYSDMAYHLEMNPKAKVSFNFVPILLDQLEDYATQFKTNCVKDPILKLLCTNDLWVITPEERRLIKNSCFKSYHEKMLKPFPDYERLYKMYEFLTEDGRDDLIYLSGQYLADLLVWYHLAWMGESVRQNNTLVQHLMTKGKKFTNEDRLALYDLVGELIANLIPRYKKLAESGQIEISSTPHYHPILPLLIDFETTRDAMTNATLPKTANYPGGITRAVDHLRDASASHKRRFGMAPNGMWPSEGAVSKESLLLMASEGVQWAASGEGVLANSLRKSNPKKALLSRHDYLYRPYKVSQGDNEITCFFRDDRLSDKIGFEYSKLHSSEAVSDFIQTLEHIYNTYQRQENPVVSVILDGENAWEYYPYNGHYFLTELYEALSNHPNIQMVTQSEVLKAIKAPAKSPYKIQCGHLPEISAGSWVYGSFSTWIGSVDKNYGWDLLCEAKKSYDKVIKSNKLSTQEKQRAEVQLSVCEGSDWFWWLGDYNAAMSVSSFDQLYRRNLMNLYRLLKLPVPEHLNASISLGDSQAANDSNSGTMRRGQE